MTFLVKFLLLLFILPNPIVCLEDIHQNGYIAIASPVQDSIVTSNVLAEYQGIQIASRCLELCTKEDSCLSFFYQPKEKLCNINSVVLHHLHSLWEFKEGTVYYLRIFFGVCGSLDFIYHPVSNICYKYYPGLRFNQSAALAHCLNEGSQLISLDTMDKFNHILDFFKSSTDLVAPKRGVFVGAINENGEWRWLNGSPLSNTSPIWAPLNPGNRQTPFYGRLVNKYGFLLVNPNSDNRNRVICERVPT